MKPLIKFEYESGGTTFADKAIVASVWPVVRDKAGVALGKSVVDSQLLRFPSGASTSAISPSVMLARPGTYLVKVAFPDGRQTQRTISVSATQDYRFRLSTGKVPAAHSVFKPAAKVAARMVSAAVKSIGNVDEVLQIARVKSNPKHEQSRGLSELPRFLKQFEGEEWVNAKPKDQISKPEFVASRLLKYSGLNEARFSYARSWLVVGDAAKAQTLIVYQLHQGLSRLAKSFLFGQRDKERVFRILSQCPEADPKTLFHNDWGTCTFAAAFSKGGKIGVMMSRILRRWNAV